MLPGAGGLLWKEALFLKNTVVPFDIKEVLRPSVAPSMGELGQEARNFPAQGVREISARGMHLGFLNGLRGLAVLYVLCYHARLTRLPELPQAGIAGWLTNGLLYGHLAVDVFIVLSGFCLMLIVARRRGWQRLCCCCGLA